MIEYFRLTGPHSNRLVASAQRDAPGEVSLCPATEGDSQHRNIRHTGRLTMEVKHDDRSQWIIEGLFAGPVFHARLIEEFERRGFTGYRLRPATVRFRDGELSNEYAELIVTGWAGVARPESGILLKEACTACGHKTYTRLQHPDKLIDWTQWTGEDFFMVWPLPADVLITKRVADALAELKVNGYAIERIEPSRFEHRVGSLSNYLPVDLAIRYGQPLGLECEPNCWPAAPPLPASAESEKPARFVWKPSPAEQCAKCIQHGDPAVRAAAVAQMRNLLAGPNNQFHACHACLELFESQHLTPEDAAVLAPAILIAWRRAEAWLQPRQQDPASIEWVIDAEYAPWRANGEVELDLLGFLPGDDVLHALREALTLADPRLKCFAVTSLLRRGESVDPAEIEHVARSLEMRMVFSRQLKKLGKLELMPERWLDPAELAASDLSHWASHPNELAAPPEEVQLMMKVLVESEDGPPEEVYLFRFREYPKPWEPGEGWMAGIAGPIRDGESHGSPWSSFKRWDEMTPQEHFQKLYYRYSACALKNSPGA